ncbi:hypothetical protein WGP40_00630 [Brachymonas sp. G13]|uniref:hypothetical protein n=1 Tax=Brachymonas TaxID=28219 RepID=UPI0016A776C8|nr:hypothetical protein [Brachymonas sp. J145]MEE1652339.1 hypothetical protein [Brachymonas sp. J145]NLX16545.1 hypothetical protein [Ramlibacter sp.]
MAGSFDEELAQAAARLVVEEGLEFGPAKQRALKQLKLPARTALPGNDLVEAAVREYLAVFCADTQPAELLALRELALQWMDRLQAFQPLVSGAVWHGTATRLSDIYLHLFSDDPKAVEISLINEGVDYEASRVAGLRGVDADALSIHAWSPELQEDIGVHLLVHDTLAQRGSLQLDQQQRKPRGTASQLRELINQD